MGGLGMPEIMIIMVIALIVFGPRKLPELGKSLGKAMNQFKRASEDFKQTWEQEVEVEKTKTSVASSSESSSNYDSHSGYDSGSSYDHSYDAGHYPYDSTSPEQPAVTESSTTTPENAAPENNAEKAKKTSAPQWI